MGGCCIDSPIEKTTHLVLNTVFNNPKFQAAMDLRISIMKSNFIDEVWEQSQTEQISINSGKIIDEYTAPIFYGINLATTGFSKSQNEKFQQYVEQNGGKYTSNLRVRMTNALV